MPSVLGLTGLCSPEHTSWNKVQLLPSQACDLLGSHAYAFTYVSVCSLQKLRHRTPVIPLQGAKSAIPFACSRSGACSPSCKHAMPAQSYICAQGPCNCMRTDQHSHCQSRKLIKIRTCAVGVQMKPPQGQQRKSRPTGFQNSHIVGGAAARAEGHIGMAHVNGGVQAPNRSIGRPAAASCLQVASER